MRALGLTDARIDGWASLDRIRRVFPSAYAVGHRPPDEKGRIQAAVLACGPGALASHRSAAYLLGIAERSPRVIDVIALGQRGREIDGIRAHRVPFPAPSEKVRTFGIPCTSVARTIVDLAGTYGLDGMRRTVEMAATRRVLDIATIEAVLEDGPRRRGAPGLRRVIEEWRPVAETARYATVRSLFEAKLLPLFASAGLPPPRINAPVRTPNGALEVDLLWPEHRFVVEADSRRFHAIEIAFERDRRRDRELMAAGHAVLRVTWREAEKEPEAVFAVIRDELRRRAKVSELRVSG